MSLSVQTNVQSLAGQRSLTSAVKANDDAMAKLSSGFRINKSADDAAGLAISDKLRADIRTMGVAARNANDGVSMLQTAEGGMNEITNILTRLRELSTQAASDTIGNSGREFLQKEFSQLKDEIDRISSTTEYNGTILLRGGSKDGLPAYMIRNANSDPLEIQVGKDWSYATDGLPNTEDLSDDPSDDTNDSYNPFKRNPMNIIRLSFKDINTSASGEGGLDLGESSDNTLDTTGVHLEGEMESKSKLRAQRSLETIDKALQKVSEYRATIGAYQNRLGSTISNLSIQMENYTAANSRIRDTDFAMETANLTQSNILKQSAVATLAQANQSPSVVLRLLGT